MNYSVIKLSFQTSVHFGESDSALSLYTSEDHFRADTLFSALCHTALSLKGTQGVDELVNAAKSGNLLFSDSMPWHEDTLYLPKPMITSENRGEVSNTVRKSMKKLKWIPVEAMERFCGSVKNGTPFSVSDYTNSFGSFSETTKVHVGADPYQIGIYTFQPKCGLYFIMAYESKSLLKQVITLLEVLGMTGIGGKSGEGYGKYTVEAVIYLDTPFDDVQTNWLFSSLTENAEKALLITTSLPKENEMTEALSDASFQMIRRGGFIRSDAYSDHQQKKETQYFINSGAVFGKRFAGDVYLVGKNGNHDVFRYGKPIFLGVSL